VLDAIYEGETYYSDRDMDEPSDAHDARATALTEQVQGERFLDVGCGLGGLVEAMGRKGWSAVGIETSRIGAERARARGRDVRHGSWDDIDLSGEGPFDLVTFIHVLEHLSDPYAALCWAGAQLRSGGMLLIEVPNRNTWETRRSAAARKRIYDLPAHLHHFTERSLAQIVGAAGFTDVRASVSVPDTALRMVDGLARLRGVAGDSGAAVRQDARAAAERRDGENDAPPSSGARQSETGPRRGVGARMLEAVRRVAPGYKLTAWARWP